MLSGAAPSPTRNSSTLTDFDGTEQAAAISRDGRFVAFLSDRDGRMDVWVTQVGTGQFHNLTRGRVPGARQSLGPHDGLLTGRRAGDVLGSKGRRIRRRRRSACGPCLRSGDSHGRTWKAWPSSTGPVTARASSTTRPGPGTRRSCRDPGQGRGPADLHRGAGTSRAFSLSGRRIRRFIYFVQGAVPDAMDIWRIRPSGGAAERMTSSQLAREPPGHAGSPHADVPRHRSGWLRAVAVQPGRRAPRPHRVSSGVDRYTSLAASADGRRLVTTLASPKGTLWRMRWPTGRSTRRPPCPSRSRRERILPAARAGLPVVRLVERAERQYLEARGRHGDRAVDRAGRAHRWKPGDRPGRTSHRILDPAAGADAAVRDECRWHGRPRRDRIARSAGRSGVGATTDDRLRRRRTWTEPRTLQHRA